PDVHVVLASRATLAAAPLGAALGIPGAPDSLPPRGALRSGTWTLCSTGGRVGLAAGVPVRGGHPLIGTALLVSTVDGDDYLLYEGRRLRIPQPGTALAALGWSARQPVPVAADLVNTLPAGPDLR